MKTFSYFILIIMMIILGGLFLNSGISARNDKYINDVILAEKGGNSLENNKDKLFVERMFALNSLIYNENIVGTIDYNNTISIDNMLVDVSISIDIYQTMPLIFDDNIKYYFHGIVNEFTSSLEDNPVVTIYGYYEENLGYDSNYVAYQVKNFDFPIFGLNNTITNSKVNHLKTAVFVYRNVELFEIVLTDSNQLTTSYYLNEFENYPNDLLHFYNTVVDTLTVRTGGFKEPNLDELNKLNSLNYNYHILENQEQYNYLIYIYMGIYVIILLLIVYFVFLKKIIRKRG